jgi:hypothetical protein
MTIKDYALGVLYNSDAWHKIPGTALRILKARFVNDLGPRHYSLFSLNDSPSAEWGNYLVDVEEYKESIRAQSPAEMHTLANDKAVFYRHCLAHGLACPPIVCAVNIQPGLYGDVPCAETAEDLDRLLQAADGRLFAKQLAGSLGRGAFSIEKIGPRYTFAGVQSGDARELMEFLRHGQAVSPQWLIQPRLQNHPELAKIQSPHALGTMRLVTYMANGEAHLLYALMKLTVGSNVTDNFMHGTTGNLVAKIDINEGRLAQPRGSLRRDWPQIRTINKHPDTGALVAGTLIPQWDDVKDLALRAQRSAPQLKSSGWDVALTPQGPVLLEANLTYSTDILQVAYARGIRTELMAALQT